MFTYLPSIITYVETCLPPHSYNLLYCTVVMAETESKEEKQDFRKGMIVFIFFLAIIIAIGVYLWQEARVLNEQYERINVSTHLGREISNR